MTLRSPHETHEADVNAIKELIAGSGPDDAAERERLLWQLVGIHAGALTPVSENEKRGMERVLAILERKLAEGGGSTDDTHNRFYRGRWSAFRECAMMLRAAIGPSSRPEQRPPRHSGEAVKCANNAVVKSSVRGTIILLRFGQRRCAGG